MRRRHIKKDKAKTVRAIRECSDDRVSIWYDNKNENWLVYWKRDLVDEFLTGESFNINKVKQWVKRVKCRTAREEVIKVQRMVDEAKKKREEEHKDATRRLARELHDHTKEPFAITDKRGEATVFTPRKKLYFHVDKEK